MYRNPFDKKSKLEVFKGEAARPAILEDKSNTWSHHVFQYNEEIAEGTLEQYGSFLSVDCEQILVSVIKKAEDNEDIIIRCYETNKASAKGQIRIPSLSRFL